MATTLLLQEPNMKLLSGEEALAWARSAGLGASSLWSAGGSGPAGAGEWRFRIQVPAEAIAIVALGYTIAITGVPEYDEGRFEGALLWLQQWEIWSESIDRTGYALMDGVRKLSGQVADEPDFASAQVFGPGEFYWACASLCVPMMFQWDARFVELRGRHAVIVSHEGFLDFITWAESTHEELLIRFQQWNPQPAG